MISVLVGVVCYLLLSDNFPFTATSPDELYQVVVAGNVAFPNTKWGSVSEDAMDFIKQLLTVDPEQRPTAEKALCHPWLKKARLGKSGYGTDFVPSNDSKEIDVQRASSEARSALDNLRKFSPSKWKEAVQTFIASQLLLSEEKKAIDQVFRDLGKARTAQALLPWLPPFSDFSQCVHL